MPHYDFKCPACGWAGSRICSIATRDDQRCREMIDVPPAIVTDGGYARVLCGSPVGTQLNRDEIHEVTIDTKGSYQCGAIMSNGQHVAGHFNREAPRRKPVWRRP